MRTDAGEEAGSSARPRLFVPSHVGGYASVCQSKSDVTIRRRTVTISAMQYWVVKQEPEAYSWTDFVKDGKTAWTGVRNFQARNNLRTMKLGDPVFFYHSVTEKQVVGVARVAREAYADPTATEG